MVFRYLFGHIDGSQWDPRGKETAKMRAKHLTSPVALREFALAAFTSLLGAKDESAYSLDRKVEL
jgi:hypothetical protein